MELLTLSTGEAATLQSFPAQVGRLFFAAGTVLPPTRHDRDELSFIHSGVLRAVCGGTAVTLRGGDVSFIPAGEEHEAEVLEDITLSYVLIAPR